MTRMEKGISFFSSPPCILIGRTTPQTPITARLLNRLEPMTLLMAISLLPDREAMILTEASGALVPNATIVRPMIMDGTRSVFAMEEHPSTNRSAPFTRNTKPSSSHRYIILFFPLFLICKIGITIGSVRASTALTAHRQGDSA